MNNILPFKKVTAKEKHKGKTLCKSGFHKWETVITPFDVKQGEMLTTSRCKRCGLTKTEKK